MTTIPAHLTMSEIRKDIDRIDESLVKQRLDELNALEVVVAALETYK